MKKSYEEWLDSKKCFADFVQEGDIVDNDMVDYFIEVLPPITWNSNVIQMGECYDFDGNGKRRYLTLEKKDGEWIYTGIKTINDVFNLSFKLNVK